jgi:glycosyltransferase involved in cell wall biosynthesis
MNFILTFCIPTYNRETELIGAIKSIISSILNYKDNHSYNFEIIVSDNCSTDQTILYLDNFIAENKFKNIYILKFRNSDNIGPSSNLISCSKLANGKYIWFFSDDDIMMIDGVHNIITDLTTKQFSFSYATRILVNDKLERIEGISAQPKLLNNQSVFGTGMELLKKLNIEITSIIPFFSSIVILRHNWLIAAKKVEDDNEFSYLNILFEAIKVDRCIITAKPCVLCRINYRGFKRKNSYVWIDSFIKSFNFAKNIGYDEIVCKEMVTHILSSHSKLYVIDKANSFRNSNLFKLRNRLSWYKNNYYDRWFFISLIPANTLRILYIIIKYIRSKIF